MKRPLLTLILAAVPLLFVATHGLMKAEDEDKNPDNGKIAKTLLVRVTYYVPDAKWGDHISSDPHRRAEQGRTAAVDPEIIPYGSLIHLPGIGKLVAEDTGTDVKARKASGKHGNIPVVDVYVEEMDEATRLSREMPETMWATVLMTPEKAPFGNTGIIEPPAVHTAPPQAVPAAPKPQPRWEFVSPQPDMA